jgi:hypothetical protein
MRPRFAWAGLACVAIAGRAAAGDHAAAESQLRVASRLAAERSASAPGAFEKVVALDPGGPLADDALLALARFYHPPERIAEASSLDASRSAAAGAALTRLIDSDPRGPRAAEARYLRAMLRLAPLSGRDPAGAREDLIEAAGRPGPDPFVSRARAALGALDEEQGLFTRAAGSYARVLVEDPKSEAAREAAGGFARTLLRAGRFGEAAVVAQQAGLDALRDLAMKSVLRARSPEGRWSSRQTPWPAIPGPRGAALLAARPDGGFVVYDRKAGSIQSYDAGGRGTAASALPDVTALTVDPFGRVHAAAGDQVVRLDPAGPVVVASLGSLAPASALAVDAAGAVLVVDRKGDRVGRFAAGATSWELLREGRGSSLVALVQDRGRAIAADEKTGGLVALAAGKAEAAIGGAVFRRPVGLAVDSGGQIAVLDAKQESVTLLDREGRPRDTLATAAIGIERPVAIAFGPEGDLLVLDAATGAVTRVR